MDPDVANFGVVMVIIVVVVAALASITVRFIRNVKPQSRKELPSPLYEQRLDQLQQSVDAIAVEVERIAEAQRFSAKLLAERPETPALPR
jgi:cytochrome c-type biogenesis protein CcmH/NrfG